MTPEATKALAEALVTIGPNKGLLKAKAPASDTLAYAAWQGAQINCNPYKVSIAALVWFSEEQRAIYNEVDAYFTEHKIKHLDRDRNALQSLGVW